MRRRRPNSSASALDVALNDLVGRFVADVAAMARTTAMAALARGVGGERESHRHVAPKPQRRTVRGHTTSARTLPPREFAALGAAVVSHLLARPDQTPRALVAALGVPRETLGGALRELLSDRLVRAKGRGRGRRYSAAPTATSRT
jgi:DNA-binding transcriptional ArsR family regulator